MTKILPLSIARAVILLLIGLGAACEGRPPATEPATAVTIEPPAVEEKTADAIPTASEVEEALTPPETAPPELNLSLPGDDRQGGAEDIDWTQSQRGGARFFEPRAEEEQRLKLKAKLLLREEDEAQPGMSNYRDSVDGAEMGFEYKMR